jgi:hypothetical protein
MPSLLNDIRYALTPSVWISEALGFNPDQKQREILDSNHKRIIINCHRQWGKSTISSLLCLHRALFYPGSLCLIVAPALRQSSENFRKVLDFLAALERPDLVEDTKLSLTLANNSRILSLPGGNEGATIRGFSGPAIIIEDESARCSDELYQALRPMMASNPDCRLILASTPWGQRGHFYKTWTEEDGWLKIKVPVNENPRIDGTFLEEEKRALGPFIYQQEYEGEFVASETQLIDFAMIKRALNPNIPIIKFRKVNI